MSRLFNCSYAVVGSVPPSVSANVMIGGTPAPRLCGRTGVSTLSRYATSVAPTSLASVSAYPVAHHQGWPSGSVGGGGLTIGRQRITVGDAVLMSTVPWRARVSPSAANCGTVNTSNTAIAAGISRPRRRRSSAAG